MTNEALDEVIKEITKTTKDLRYDLLMLGEHVFSNQKSTQNMLKIYEDDINDIQANLMEMAEQIPEALESTKTGSEYESTIKMLLTDDFKEQRTATIEEVIKVIKANQPKQNNKLLYLLVFISLGVSLYLMFRSFV